jgi:hypothetical protein
VDEGWYLVIVKQGGSRMRVIGNGVPPFSSVILAYRQAGRAKGRDVLWREGSRGYGVPMHTGIINGLQRYVNGDPSLPACHRACPALDDGFIVGG